MKRSVLTILLATVVVLALGALTACSSSDSVEGSYHCTKVEQVSEMTIDLTDAVGSMCSLELKGSGDATITLEDRTIEGTWEESGDQVLINGGETVLYKDDDGDLKLTVDKDLFTYNYVFSK